MSKVMNGSVEYPMSARIKDTVAVHGFMWAYRYYVVKHGFKAWEFFTLAGVPSGLTLCGMGVNIKQCRMTVGITGCLVFKRY